MRYSSIRDANDAGLETTDIKKQILQCNKLWKADQENHNGIASDTSEAHFQVLLYPNHANHPLTILNNRTRAVGLVLTL